MTVRSYIRRPRAAATGLKARQVAKAYGCPIDRASGTGVTIGVIELGGAVQTSDLNAVSIDPARVVSVPVAGGKPKSDGADGADGEVALDVQVIAEIAPGARVRVYFAPNTDAGFLAAIEQAVTDGCQLISISWGGPEGSWSKTSITQFEKAFADARARGVLVFAAAGDSGSRDGTKANAVDYPASSPNVIGCGGTRLELNADGTRKSEVTWDDNDTSSATGGGVSKQFTGRSVPDVAGNADPESGYDITVDGERGAIGGTSAVAPLLAGCCAVLLELLSKPFDFLAVVAANPSVCFDIVSGDNGGFRAGPGRDNVSGYGVVDFGRLLAVLSSGTAPPVVTPPPTSVPPANADRAFIEDVAARCTAYLKAAS